MSCNDDLDFLGIPNVDLSKWKTVNPRDINDRLENVEEIVQDTNSIVKRILSKLEDQEEDQENDYETEHGSFDHGISFDDDFDSEFDSFEFDK